MADTPDQDDRDRSAENAKLELPSLRLGRRKRKPKRAPDENPPPVGSPAPVPSAPESPPDPAPEPQPVATLTPEPEAATEPEAEPQPESPAPPEPQRPAKHPRLEAIVVGLLVGAVGAGLFYASLQGCDVVRGTESCGGGPGLLLVVVILGLMVLLGAVLLTARAVAEPRSTSFLGVGLLCVVLMVAALQQVFSSWMFLVVPLVSAAAYLIAHWVTTTYVEPQPEKGPEHDVR